MTIFVTYVIILTTQFPKYTKLWKFCHRDHRTANLSIGHFVQLYHWLAYMRYRLTCVIRGRAYCLWTVYALQSILERSPGECTPRPCGRWVHKDQGQNYHIHSWPFCLHFEWGTYLQQKNHSHAIPLLTSWKLSLYWRTVPACGNQLFIKDALVSEWARHAFRTDY